MPYEPSCGWGDGCDEPRGFGKFGSFCADHVVMLQASVAAKGGRYKPKGQNGECAVDGCTKFATTNAVLCGEHEIEFGTPEPDEPEPDAPVAEPEEPVTPKADQCLVDGCERPRHGHRATCGSRHSNGDVDTTVLAGFRAARRAVRGKPGPKPVAA